MTSTVENLQHAAERKAFAVAIDKFLNHLDKSDVSERTETYLKLIDAAEKFWGKNGARKETLDKVREYVKNPENRWVKFINRVIDETDRNYAKKMLLNLGYEAFFRGGISPFDWM